MGECAEEFKNSLLMTHESVSTLERLENFEEGFYAAKCATKINPC